MYSHIHLYAVCEYCCRGGQFQQLSMVKQVVFRDFRVSFLCNDVIRVEKSRKGVFCDEDTFFFPHRNELSSGEVEFTVNENVITFGDYQLVIPTDGDIRSFVVNKQGETVYKYKRLKNSGELPRPYRTPEIFAISDNPRVFVPVGGYSVNRQGEYRIEENVDDVYLLFVNNDALKLRSLYVQLTGRNQLVRRATFGSWNSKYYAYHQKEAEQVILDYEKRNVPLDNIVIDTDWRKSLNGWGYDINEQLFYDMKGFLSFAHQHGVEVMFNDHPEPLNGAHVFEPQEIAYREEKLQSMMDLGLDTWWYDRNWHTHLNSPSKNLKWETLGLYLYHDITRNYYLKKSDSADVYKRPVVMGNVVEVSNGEYRKIKDSASHRYPIQWTGDIGSQPCNLAEEIENLVLCTDSCIPYMNSDCGGHTGNPDKEEFIRWMQYGVMSPVFRPHCTKDVERFREPWAYDEETLDIVRSYNLLRYRLIPYIYANAYQTYLTGIGMFRSLSLEFPRDVKACRKDEYMFGSNLLIAPISGNIPRKLAKSCYLAPVEVQYFDGTECSGQVIATDVWDKIDMSLNHTSPKKGVPVYNFSAKLRTTIRVNKPKQLYIKSDDGVTVYLDGKCVLEDKTMHSATMFSLVEISPDETHTLEINYFQAGGEACLALYVADVAGDGSREVYLPSGKWMDLFDGHIYNGNTTIRKNYKLSAMPLFVRLGAVIPLIKEAQTTAQQDWTNITYDYYPDMCSKDSGYLYEDDGQTTAYLKGQYRKSEYSACYDEQEKAFVLRFYGAEGSFGADDNTMRTFNIKFHSLNQFDVKYVELNGKKFNCTKHCSADVFPLSTEHSALDGDVFQFSFEGNLFLDNVVKFYI